MYREVLRSSEEHKGRLKTDSLQVRGLLPVHASFHICHLHMKALDFEIWHLRLDRRLCMKRIRSYMCRTLFHAFPELLQRLAKVGASLEFFSLPLL